jgi:hypothetical protein
MIWRSFAWAAAALAALFAAWYFGARPAALLLGDGAMRQTDSRALTRIGWNGSFLLIDSRTLGLEKSDNTSALHFSVDAQHRLVASVNGQSLVLGVADGTLSDGGEATPAFAAAPPDRAAFTRAQGAIAWPNWFDLNFMTGNSPSWKRFVTYDLVWTKPSGASLTIRWRFEQYYYESEGRWMDADMACEDVCGIVAAKISPPSNR